MRIHIKNMVCPRCIIVVNSILEKLNLHPTHITLGVVEIAEDDISEVRLQLVNELRAVGFELLDSKRTQIIERIKNTIIELVHLKNNHLESTLSDYISKKLLHDYSWLSNLFSEVEGISIEKYYINQKIEKVKELIIYNELSLSEIAYQLNYSSPAYLSSQFKKTTGMTASHFKNLAKKSRNSLDEL